MDGIQLEDNEEVGELRSMCEDTEAHLNYAEQCKELWSEYGGEGFVSQSPWPECDDDLVSVEIEKSEELVQNIIKDITQIKKMVKGDVSKVHIYFAKINITNVCANFV